ncbi:MAG: LysR family transcriptional regulator [Planctomycetota bacterium]
MDTDQLVHFRRIAELSSFTKAAEQLGMSQPALSRSIQRLEDEVGQPLFDRKTRTVDLTDAGVLFRGRAEHMILLLEDTKAELKDDGERGRVRVGAIPTIAPFFLPDLLRQFVVAHAQAQIIVIEETTDELMKRVRQGEVDLAILALPIPGRYLEVTPLFDEELSLVVPVDHDLVAQETIHLSDVERLPFVLLNEAHCLSDNVTSFCQQRGFQPVVIERTSQLMTVQELVALGHGVSMIPAMSRKRDASNNRVYRSISGNPPKRTVAMVWNPYRFESKLVHRFRDFVQQYAKSFEAS